MIVFWLLAALMVAVALLMVLPPLFGKQRSESIDRKEQNVVIAKERLEELETEHENGELSDEEFAYYRDELEQSLLGDLTGEETPDTHPHVQHSKQSALALIVMVPIAAIGLYLFLGNPVVLKQENSDLERQQAAGGEQMPSVDSMVEKLAERMKSDPDNAEGWSLLAQSYMTMEDYGKAAWAMENLNRLIGDNPNIMLQYADALAMTQGRKLSGKPAELIEKALTLDPDHIIGLWMAGMLAEQQGDLKKAIEYWSRAEGQLDSEPQSQQELRAMIQQAETQLGIVAENSVLAETAEEKESAGGASIKVQVSLDPALEQHVALNDTLFILARAVDGPPMPLAAVKRQAKELPIEVVLDDSMAMMPAMKLSNFEQVRITARISKSGNTNAQSGDLEGEVNPVSVGAADTVTIVIQKQIP